MQEDNGIRDIKHVGTIQRDFNWFSLNFKIEFIFPQSKKMCGFFLSGFFVTHGRPQWPSGKESICNAGDSGSIPGLGRVPGGGNGNPLQYSRLENPMNRGTWWATVHGVTESWTRRRH